MQTHMHTHAHTQTQPIHTHTRLHLHTYTPTPHTHTHTPIHTSLNVDVIPKYNPALLPHCQLTLESVFADEILLHVGRHVEAEREGEVGVDLLLRHRHHVECVPHRVEAQDLGKALEARPEPDTHQ